MTDTVRGFAVLLERISPNVQPVKGNEAYMADTLFSVKSTLLYLIKTGRETTLPSGNNDRAMTPEFLHLEYIS
jgi:hypothetical protein